VFRNSKPTTSVRREYQGISLASSPTNHTPAPQLYGLSRYGVNGIIRTVPVAWPELRRRWPVPVAAGGTERLETSAMQDCHTVV